MIVRDGVSPSRDALAVKFLTDIDRMGMYVSPGGHRAVHKPLLVLMMLGRIQQGQSARVAFDEIEAPLDQLIAEFGRTSVSRPRAHYPFWYLKSDVFWSVDSEAELVFRWGKSGPRVSSLRQLRITAGFTSPVAASLLADDGLVREAAMRVLRKAFPEPRYVDVLSAVGLQLTVEVVATRRDAAFRREILRAYNARCALCGYAGRLALQPVGIEAAHIKWVHFGGPNELTNGIALCSLHHKLFDAGAFTASPGTLRLHVSPQFDGTDPSAAMLVTMANSDSTVSALLRGHEHPDAQFLDWHAAQVFMAETQARSAKNPISVTKTTP